MYFIPDFKSGQILKKNMLEALRDNPKNVLDIQYANYGDGIIIGFDVTIENEKEIFLVGPGIIKNNGELYFSSIQMSVDMQDERNYVYLEVDKKNYDNGEEVCIHLFSSKLEKKDEIELFRYTKTSGAEVLEYSDFKEIYDKCSNRLDRRFANMSINGGSTIHQSFMKCFAKEMMSKKIISNIDAAFAFACMNGINDIMVIEQYFRKKSLKNSDLIVNMWRILQANADDDKDVNDVQEEIQEQDEMICVG